MISLHLHSSLVFETKTKFVLFKSTLTITKEHPEIFRIELCSWVISDMFEVSMRQRVTPVGWHTILTGWTVSYISKIIQRNHSKR